MKRRNRDNQEPDDSQEVPNKKARKNTNSISGNSPPKPTTSAGHVFDKIEDVNLEKTRYIVIIRYV